MAWLGAQTRRCASRGTGCLGGATSLRAASPRTRLGLGLGVGRSRGSAPEAARRVCERGGDGARRSLPHTTWLRATPPPRPMAATRHGSHAPSQSLYQSGAQARGDERGQARQHGTGGGARAGSQSQYLIRPSQPQVATLEVSSGCHSAPMHTWSCALKERRICGCARGGARAVGGGSDVQQGGGCSPRQLAPSHHPCRTYPPTHPPPPHLCGLPIPDVQLALAVPAQHVARVPGEPHLAGVAWGGCVRGGDAGGGEGGGGGGGVQTQGCAARARVNLAHPTHPPTHPPRGAP